MSRTRSITAEIRLVLTDEQSELLQALRDSRSRGDLPLVPTLTVSPRFGVDRALIIRGTAFVMGKTQVRISGIGKLATVGAIPRQGVGFEKKYVCLVERKSGWSAHITMVKRPRDALKSSRNSRLHNHAAIFITDAVTPSKVSGGLPSLGKRK